MGRERKPLPRHVRLGSAIQTACDAVGSQAELARRLGVTDRAVNNWVNGRNEPCVTHLWAIAVESGVSLRFLMAPTFDDYMESEVKEA